MRRPVRLALAFLAIASMALLMQMGQAPDASAGQFGFCNVTLGPSGRCESGYNYMNQVAGVGYSGAVCVGYYPSTESCSGGPNQWVYTPSSGSDFKTAGWIANQRTGASNVVDAVYYY
jgi:hypothetical protein